MALLVPRGRTSTYADLEAWRFTIPAEPDGRVLAWLRYTRVHLWKCADATGRIWSDAVSNYMRFALAAGQDEVSFATIDGKRLAAEVENGTWCVTADSGSEVQVTVASTSLFPLPHEVARYKQVQLDGRSKQIVALAFGRLRRDRKPRPAVENQKRWAEAVSERSTAEFAPFGPPLKANDLVKHPTFGAGLVLGLDSRRMARVAFWDDVAVLALGADLPAQRNILRPLKLTWRPAYG